MLNPDLELGELARRFGARGRVAVANAFDPALAGALHAHLVRERWGLAYRDGSEFRQRDPAEVAKMTREEVQTFNRYIMTSARDHYQFVYGRIDLPERFAADRDSPLGIVLEALNGSDVIEAARAISGDSSIVKVFAQATLFLPGQFLHPHTDEGSAQKRKLAFVWNLARGWKPEYGGLLCFLNAEGGVEEGWTPQFNTLALFRTTLDHMVTYVPPFAPAARYAISGWFLAD